MDITERYTEPDEHIEDAEITPYEDLDAPEEGGEGN